jgi:tRNA nucleotidyltransferase/poly(A) polymerase
MPDYIYLLENRLSAEQQHALRQLREAAREAGMILFLTGDAVRDLTSGHAVRDLEVAVHGNALKLKKPIEMLGGTVWGESELSRTLYLCFPGTVRVDLVSTHRMDYANVDKPVYHSASIQEDLRRRDFTVNAMAISLNEGSFGLLMDPLNGAADIEARTLRLVSNYGFLEDPSLLIRATRYKARLGWDLDTRTQTRYENARGEDVIQRLSDEARSRELEQIGHEDEGLKVLRALADEGWMNVLFPAWNAAKADEDRLKALHDLAVELLMQGIHADMSAAQMQLLTAKLAPKELSALKKLLLRPGFVEEWNSLDAVAAKFAKVLLSKEHASASAGFKLFTSYDPEAVLWLGFTSKDKAVQARYNEFLKVWPEARQKTPHALMQEMRITPDLAAYKEIVQAIFLELIDGKLTTVEEMRAFLEPHSPPAPPPQVTIKRPRAKRGEAKVKERTYDDDEDSEDSLDEDDDLDDLGGDDDEIDLGLAKHDADSDLSEDSEAADDDLDPDEGDQASAAGKRAGKGAVAKSDSKTESAADVRPKVSPPAVKLNAKEPESRKDDKMSKKKAEAPAEGAAPLQDTKPSETVEVKASGALTPGAKPPQATSTTEVLASTGGPLNPGAKPPQAAKRRILASTGGPLTPGAKPPQAVKKPVLAAKPVKAAAKAKPAAKKAAPVKTAKKAVPAKAVKKAVPVKKKVAPAKKKPAAKPVPKPKKKAAAPAKAKKTASKGKKR